MFRRISFPTLLMGWIAFIAICILAMLFNNPAHAQNGANQTGANLLPSSTNALFHDDMAPGVIGSIQLQNKPYLRGLWQGIEVKGPRGVHFNLAQDGQFAPDIASPARVAVLVGAVYRLRLTGIEGYEDVELFPTIEVIDRTCPPAEREHRFPIPIEIDETDIADAMRGEMVMRVIYLEDSEIAEPVDTSNKPQRVLDVRPAQNALRTADQLGRPVAILRMGSRVPHITSGQDALEFYYGCPPWTTLKPIPTKEQLIEEGRWPVIEPSDGGAVPGATGSNAGVIPPSIKLPTIVKPSQASPVTAKSGSISDLR